ncbi:MAG: hypothetical protein HFH07_04910 [Dorea sp.]|jgi:hypothetical protein|nr:hypothetical protein [Dorea sp.]
MSNILKVTTPVTGYDNTLSKQTPSQKAEDLSVKNPIVPDKVVRPDGRSQTGQEQGVRQGISYESNFGNFVQTLQNIPKLREIMSKMLFSGMGNLVEAGVSKGTAAEIEALLNMLSMSPDKLKDFLKSQMSGANRLQGPLFDMLRQVMGEATTVELKQSILDFLKKYNDMSSGKHLLENIKGELKEMEGYMFRSDREALQSLSSKLLEYSMENNRANAQLLKEQIIPFLGRYVSETRDLGTIRDLISLLTLNTSRYENGNVDSVAQAFQRLMEFPAFQKKFGGMSAEEFRNMLMNVDFDRAAGKAEWADSLLSIIRSGVRGEAGIENREAFMNIMNGLLINESVYMPVLHVMLPLILNGVPVFSEMWVDPDEESGNEGSSERGVKLLLKFDMKEVGFFDMIMYYENGKMDMMLRYPESLSQHEGEIRKGIAGIMEKNKVELEYLAVEQGKESIPVSAAFPKIFERRNAVNVTI